MKTFGITLLATVALGLVAAKSPSDPARPRGVSKSKAKFYTPDSAGRWKCLDGSKTISFQAVNDDYCDCPDGSDEPGTSACGTGYFYCENVGHTPAYIRSSRVNDGVCDAECCDGTDEYSGRVKCPNVCDEIGAKARAERDRVNAILEKGAKLRQEYSEHGKKLKSELQTRLETLKGESEKLREAVKAAKESLEKAQAAQEKLRESSKAHREAARAADLEPLIEEQEKRLTRAKEARELLYKTLENLQANYNKNFHDMSVKSTVTGFEDFVSSQKKDDEEDSTAGEGDEETLAADRQLNRLTSQTEDIKRKVNELLELLIAMRDGYNKEYNDPAVLAAAKVADEFEPSWDSNSNGFVGEEMLNIPGELTDLSPEAKRARQGKATKDIILEKVTRLRDQVLKWIGRGPRTEVEEAQESYNYAIAADSDTTSEIQEIERKLAMDLGKDEEFAKLLDQCFDLSTAEYTYQVCLFKNAVQKSTSDTSLGTFSKWDGDDYTVQMYTGGLKCWNGPERSVKLVMSCGLENKIISVTEPEKCEYVYEFHTPAVCKMPTKADNTSEEEDEDIPMPNEPQMHRKHDEL